MKRLFVLAMILGSLAVTDVKANQGDPIPGLDIKLGHNPGGPAAQVAPPSLTAVAASPIHRCPPSVRNVNECPHR